MKILFHTSHSPYHEITGPMAAGAEIAMRNIAEGLAARGHEVYYLTFHPKFKHQIHDINGVVVHVMNKKVTTGKLGNFLLLGFSTVGWSLYGLLPKNIWNNKLRALKGKIRMFLERVDGYLWGYKYVLKKFLRTYDIELIHCFSSLPDSFASAVVSEKKGVPIVLRMGGRYWYLKYQSLSPGFQRDAYRRELEYTLKNTACLAFNSEVLREDTLRQLEELGLPRNQESPVVDIGVNIPQGISYDTNYLAKHIKPKEKVVCVVGKFKENSKRQDLIIKAIADIKQKGGDVKALFAGDGPKTAEMKDLALALDVEKECIFLGPVPREKVFALVDRADIFIHPTEFEGSSKAVAEAMLLKKPIIGSDIPPLREHLTHGENAILVENSAQAFSGAIQKMLSDAEGAERLASAAYEYATKHFDTSVNILKYEELFQDLIRARKADAEKWMKSEEATVSSSESTKPLCSMCPNRS